MKLLLIPSRFPYGPKEAFLTEEIAELSRWHEILVVPALPTRESLAVPALREQSLRLRLGSRQVLRLATAEMFSNPGATARALVSVVLRPRALHAKLKNIAIFPTALAVARIAQRERVDHVHAYWLSAPSTIAYVVSRLRKIPWSATGHRYDLVDFNVRTVGTPRAGFFPSARFVRAISKQGLERLAIAFNGDPPADVIHLGVAVPAAVNPSRSDTNEIHLLCSANLEAVKGHDVLLEALRRCADRVQVRCTFAGDGTLRSHLEAKTRKLGLERNVKFEGFVPHARLLERIDSHEFDAAILTSVDEGPAQREGIPVFLMEAMARALPVIATQSGAVDELVNDSNGILCPPGNSRAIADAIIRIARDPALRTILGAGGRRTVLAEFDARETARRLMDAIENRRPFGRKALLLREARARHVARLAALATEEHSPYGHHDVTVRKRI